MRTLNAEHVRAHLKLLRKAKGLSQGALGKLVGHNQRWISQRENGTVRLGVLDAEEIANGLGRELRIVVGEAPAQVDALLRAEPDDLQVAMLLIEALPEMEEQVRQMIIAMLTAVLESREQVAIQR